MHMAILCPGRRCAAPRARRCRGGVRGSRAECGPRPVRAPGAQPQRPQGSGCGRRWPWPEASRARGSCHGGPAALEALYGEGGGLGRGRAQRRGGEAGNLGSKTQTCGATCKMAHTVWPGRWQCLRCERPGANARMPRVRTWRQGSLRDRPPCRCRRHACRTRGLPATLCPRHPGSRSHSGSWSAEASSGRSRASSGQER